MTTLVSMLLNATTVDILEIELSRYIHVTIHGAIRKLRESSRPKIHVTIQNRE